MNQYDKSHPWGPNSPLMSLTGLALIVSASSRLSYSAAVCLLLAGIYGITLSIVHLGKSIIPQKYKTVILIMIVTFIISLFYLIMSMINPVSALALYFIVFLVPLTFLSSEIVKRTGNLSFGEGITLGMKEALILGGIIIAISFIREPLGYGTLSIPFSGKTVNLLPDTIREHVTLQVFAEPLGGFILTACLIALVRLVSRNHNFGLQKEDSND